MSNDINNFQEKHIEPIRSVKLFQIGRNNQRALMRSAGMDLVVHKEKDLMSSRLSVQSEDIRYEKMISVQCRFTVKVKFALCKN